MEERNQEHAHLGWSFRWHEDWGSVWAPDLLGQWNDMLQRSPQSSVYQRPEFIRIWARSLGADSTPLVGFGRHRSGHVALLPWVVVRHRGRMVERRIVEYGGRELSGYHDPLVVASPGHSVDWEEFWRAAAVAVSRVCDQGRMRNVRRDCAPAGSAIPRVEHGLESAPGSAR